MNKKLWTQKKEELNWDKDQRNQRYMFINYFNSNVHSKVMHACMEVISWTATCMFICWFGLCIIFWCQFKVHKYMQYMFFDYVSDILMIGGARGGCACIQILSFQQTNFSIWKWCICVIHVPVPCPAPLWEILDPQLFIVFTIFFSNYQRVYHQSQILDRYVADRHSQMRQNNEQNQRMGMSHSFDVLYGDWLHPWSCIKLWQ